MNSKFPMYFMIVYCYTWGRRPFKVKDKENHCDVITKKKKNFCVLMVMDFKWHLSFQCLWGRCTCMHERKRGGEGKEGENKGEKGERRGGEGSILWVYLLYIVNVNSEGRWPMTHSVKSSKLIVVDFSKLGFLFCDCGYFIQKCIMHLSSHILN